VPRVIFLFYFYQKLVLGAKTATGAKLRGRFCSFFSKGAKIATLGKLGCENCH